MMEKDDMIGTELVIHEEGDQDQDNQDEANQDNQDNMNEGDGDGEGEVKELGKSTSNLLEVLHGGRPKDEDPHVKRSIKKKKEKIDYIVRVSLDELGISEDEFEDLQSLFQLFDHDKDGILNFKETQKLLRCLGFRASEEQAKTMAGSVSMDTSGFSVSFNEYLTLVSLQRRAEPDESSLLDVFLSFDPESTGRIGEAQFRKIMKGKEGIPDEDVDEMLEEYRKLNIVKEDEDEQTEEEKDPENSEEYIYYKEFISMLQQ